MRPNNPTSTVETFNVNEPLAAPDSTAFDNLLQRMNVKQQEVEEARQRKLDAMRRGEETQAFKDTLLGRVSGLGVDSDFAREFNEALSRGVGSIAGGLDHVSNANPLNALGRDSSISRGQGWASVEASLYDTADNIDAAQTENFRRDMEMSTPQGNIFAPSTWSMGEDPSVRGFAAHMAGILGGFAPQAAAMLTPGGAVASMTGMATIGGLQAGGAEAHAAEEFVMSMGHETLLSESGLYRDLLAQDLSQEEARRQTAKAAGAGAFMPAAAVGGAGGAALGYILRPLQGKLVGGDFRKAITSMALAAGEEGVHEVGTTMASRAGINSAIDAAFSLTDDTFADAVLGGTFGAGLGGMGRAAAAAGEFAENREEQRRSNVVADAAIKQRVFDIVDSGNLDILQDAEQVPTKDLPAIGKGLLAVANAPADMVTAAQREQAQKALDALDGRVDDAIKQLQEHNESMSPEKLAEMETLKTKREAALAKAQADNNAVNIAKNEEYLEIINDEIQTIKRDTEKNKAARQKELNTLMNMRSVVAQSQGRVQPENSSTEIDDALTVFNDQAATPEARNAAAQKAVTLAMENADLLDSSDAIALSKNESLTTSQQNYLRELANRKDLTERLSNFATVRQDVFEGNRQFGFRGLNEYRTMVNRALKRGDNSRVGILMDQLNRFRQSHESKAAVLDAALEQARSTGKQVQVIARKEGDVVSWEINNGRRLNDKQRGANGGLNINPNPGQMLDTIESIKLEAEAIKATEAELQYLQEARSSETGSIQQPEVVSTHESTEQVTEEGEANAENVETESQANTEQDSTPVTEPAQTETSESRNTESVEPQQVQTETVSDETVARETNTEQVPEQAEATKAVETEQVQDEIEANSILDVDQDGNVLVSGQLRQDSFQTTNLKRAYILTKKDLPLTSTKDYLSTVLARAVNNPEMLGGKLSKDATIANKQQALLARFVEEAKGWNALMNPLFKKDKNEKFQYTNMLNFYADANGNLEENVQTAISAGIFSWVQDNGNDLWTNTDDDVRAILNREEDHMITQAENRLVRNVGTREANVKADLGRRIVAALGQYSHNDAPVNHMAQLEGAFGAFAMGVMLKAGHKDSSRALIQRVGRQDVLFGQEAGKTKIDGKVVTTYPVNWFVRNNNVPDIAKGDWGKNPYIKELKDAGTGTQNFLNDLFSMESRVADVHDTAPTNVPKTTRRTGQQTPKKQRDILAKAQEQRHYPRRDMLDPEGGLLPKLGRKFLLALEGYKDIDPETMQVNLVESQRGKNNGAERAVDGLFEFTTARADRLDQPFYMSRFVARQQRVHLDSRIFNPQENKLHRIAMTMDGWEMTVTKDLDDNNGLLFKYAVGEALGEKVGDMALEQVKDAFEKLQADPKIQAALATLDDVIQADREPTDAQTAVLLDAMPEGSWSLDALWHLYQLDQLKEGESFVSTLHAEGDGRTNGPMFVLAQLGVLDAEWGAKGGFFTAEQGFQDSGDWASRTENNDLYQALAKEVGLRMAVAGDAHTGTQAMNNLVYKLFGEFLAGEQVTSKGRKAVKGLLTKLMFGAGEDGSIDAMAEQMVDKIYDHVQSMIDNSTTDMDIGPELGKFVDTLNQFLGDKHKIRAKHTREGARTMTLSPQQVADLKSGFVATIGPHISATLDQQYGEVIARRQKLNQAANVAFEMYKAVKDVEHQKMLDELDIPRDKNGNRLQDLTKKQMKELEGRVAAIMPLAHTAMSKGGSLKAGLKLAKRKNEQRSEDSAAYGGRVQFGSAVRLSPSKINNRLQMGRVGNPNQATNIKYGSSVATEAPPGVAAIIMMIHSMDSGVISEVYQDATVLNVHDAAIGSPEQLVGVIQKMNKATLDYMIDYSVPEEIVQTFFRSLDGFKAYMADADADTQAAVNTALKKALKGKDPEQLAGEFLQVAEQADRAAMTWLNEVEYVSQYGFPGGAYRVTDSDRARIEARLAKPVSQRIQERMARTKAKDPALASKVLRDYLSDSEQRFQQILNEEGRVPGEDNKAFVRNLRKINQIYVETGSLDQALGQVFKGPTNKEARDTMRAKIHRRLAQSNPTTRRIADAPVGRLMNLAQGALDSRYTQDDMKTVLQEVVNGLGQLDTLSDTNVEQVIWDAAGNEVMFRQVRDLMTRMYNGYHVSPWGNLSGQDKALTAEQAVLVNALQETPVTTVGNLLPHLRRAVAAMPKDSTQQAVLGQVLAKLKEHGNMNLRVEYVTQDTPVLLAPEMNNPGGVRGAWHRDAGGKEVIYIKSPDFAESNVSVELLAHELMHSVMHDALHSNDRAVAPFINELQALRAEAKKVLDNDPTLKARYGNAVSNIDELVSWGMTDLGFQRDVLNTIEMKSKTGIVEGFKAFIKAITGLFTRKNPTAQMASGIEVMVNNVSALMEANRKQETQGVDTVLASEGPDPVTQVEGFTTEQVFDALPGNDSQRLRDVLGVVVNELHGPGGGIKAFFDRNTPMSPEDTYLQALISGEMPFASKVVASNIRMSDKELFVLEQVEVAMQGAMDTSTSAYREMVRMFNEARQKVTPAMLHDGDWATATPNEKNRANETHRFIFEPIGSVNRSDHLTRFAALAMVYAPLHRAMNYSGTPEAQQDSGKLGDRIQSLFNRGLRQFSDIANGTNPRQNARQRMEKVIQRLVQLEKRNKATLAKNNISMLDQVEDVLAKQTGGKLASAISKVGRSKAVQGSKSPIIKAVGNVAALTAEERLGTFLDHLDSFRIDAFGEQRQDFATGVVSEIRGTEQVQRELYDAVNISGIHQRRRMEIIKNTKNQVLEMFGKAAESFTERQRRSLTKGILKTGLHTLNGSFTLQQIADMVNDPAEVRSAIKGIEQQILAQGQYGKYFRNQAEALGIFMATGKVHSPNLQFNAFSIVNRYGMSDAGHVPANIVSQMEPLIDQLASLYALQNTDSVVRAEIGPIMTAQLARTDGNGVEFLMGLHAKMEAEARENLFAGDTTQMMKGYIRELYDPHREVGTAVPGTPEADRLLTMGYVQGEALAKDPSDVRQDVEHLYVQKDGGLARWVTGSISYTGMRAKGSSVHSGRYSLTREQVSKRNHDMNRMIKAKRKQAVEALDSQDSLKQWEKETLMAPVMDSAGNITNWRYMMSEDNKDALMNRDTDIGNVTGAMAGAIYDKMTTEQHNNTVIKALKAMYDADVANHPTRYIAVGPDSPDAQARQTYFMLPDSTKRAIKKIWGSNTAYVRNDTIDMVFGYREYSLTNVLDKAETERNMLEQITAAVLERVLGEKAYTRVRKYEDMWKGVANEIKDFLVIKNLWTFIANVSSNVSVLLWKGVSPKQLVRDHKVAIDGLLRYTRDSKELDRLRNLQAIGGFNGTARELQNQISNLEHEINNNPVKELLDEGMFQTIMEDIDVTDDPFSYKSRLSQWVDKKTENVPAIVKNVAKWGYMTSDTPIYKLMLKSTQMSDFVARYTHYQYVRNRKHNPMSKEDALYEIKEAYVQYDLPSHKGLDYLNKIGLVRFTKYYLRIQRVLLSMYKDQPVRAMLMLLFSKYLSDAATVQESSMLGRIGNSPLQGGAFDFPNALQQSMTIQAATKLMP